MSSVADMAVERDAVTGRVGVVGPASACSSSLGRASWGMRPWQMHPAYAPTSYVCPGSCRCACGIVRDRFLRLPLAAVGRRGSTVVCTRWGEAQGEGRGGGAGGMDACEYREEGGCR